MYETEYKTAYETEYKTAHQTEYKTAYATEYKTDYETEYKTKTVYESVPTCPPNPNTDCGKCPGKGVLRNGDFSSPLNKDTNWISLRSPDNDDAAITVTYNALSVRLNGQQKNANQRIVQSVVVCPGTKYTISFRAKKITSYGSVGAYAYIGDKLVGGGIVNSGDFALAPNDKSGTYTVPSGVNSVIVRFEFTFDSGEKAKEVQIDDVLLIQL